MRVLAAIMTLVFVFAAAVQWNDPDPARWIAFYLLAAAGALGVALGRGWRAVEIAAAVAAAGVVIALAPSLPGARVEAFTSYHMKSGEDEVVRELVGAGIALVWSLGLVVRSFRSTRRADRS